MTVAYVQNSYSVSTWQRAYDLVTRIANGLPVYWGSGYPIDHPHVIACGMDALSGEGSGYNVVIKPEGDGTGKPCTWHFIHVR